MSRKEDLALLGVLLVICTIGATADDNYYCNSDLVCLKGQHVMCNLKIAWGSSCKNPILYNVTKALRKQFLDGHNTRRNIAALGQLNGLFKGRTASDMAEMIWDDELEIYAQGNLLRCKMKHDDCRSTKRHKYAGQNLAMTCGMWSTVQEAIDGSMQMWWDEHKDIKRINTENMYSSIRSGGKYGHGHFTQMARDKAFAIGCAVISTDNDHCWYVACNYAVTNWLYSPVYARGNVRSTCNTNSTTYTGLCGKHDDYTGYKVKGITFFTHAKNDSPLLRQWQQNGRRLNVPDATQTRRDKKRERNTKSNVNMRHSPKHITKNIPNIGQWGNFRR